MRNKKTLMIGILCALVCVMAVGYAAFATQLNISGTASVDSTWSVGITNIKERNIIGDAVSKETPSYTATTANFSVGLIQPGDSITYDIEISNLGSLKAKVDSVNITMDENNAIIYNTEGVEKGDKLGINEKDILSLTVSYNPEVTSQPENTAKDISVTINYVQDLGTSGEPSTTYDTYSIGDEVNFAGSNWYVIKNSSSEEDYVTLLKEKVLTNEELGEYAASQTITCEASYAANGSYGCTIEGQIVIEKNDTIPYYWSDTCHYGGYFGYTSGDLSGCNGHNDYEGSKVKEFLETSYIATLGETNLKEVDGYKIRIIKVEELQNNLGYSTELKGSNYDYSPENTPIWVYKNFSDSNNATRGYWTMTPGILTDSVSTVTGLSISPSSIFINYGVDGNYRLRPVINLLKSSI